MPIADHTAVRSAKNQSIFQYSYEIMKIGGLLLTDHPVKLRRDHPSFIGIYRLRNVRRLVSRRIEAMWVGVGCSL